MTGLRALNMRMAAAGARWDLRSLGRVDLAAKTDAFAVQLRPGEGSAADARRLRLALEGRTRWQDHDGDTWRPALELGLRWDGGDADRGAGAELAAELAYANARHDFDLEARARRLLVHQGDGFRMWGASPRAAPRVRQPPRPATGPGTQLGRRGQPGRPPVAGRPSGCRRLRRRTRRPPGSRTR